MCTGSVEQGIPSCGLTIKICLNLTIQTFDNLQVKEGDTAVIVAKVKGKIELIYVQ